MVFRVRTYPAFGSFSPADAQFDRSVGDVIAGFLSEEDRRSAFIPPLDVTEYEKKYEVVVELPGVKREDVELKVEGGTLTIRGARKPDVDEGVKAVRTERPHGAFRRSLSLPEDVDAAGVTAGLENGILRLELPKHERHLPREIRIR